MASLLAILLVGKSSAGSQLVYAYPPHPKAVPRTHKPVYSGRRNTILRSRYESASSSSDSQPDDSDSDSDDDEYHGPDSKSFLGFPDPVLASLLSPSQELCDQPFELVLDHLAFVGHPVWLGDGDDNLCTAPSSAGSPAGPDDRADADDADDEETEETGSRGRGRHPRVPSGPDPASEAEGEAGDSTERDATVMPPSSRTASAPPRPMMIPGRLAEGPSRPDLLVRSQSSFTTTLAMGSSTVSSQHSQTSLISLNRLTSFNLLCVIDTPPDSHLSSHLEGYYNDLVLPVTASMEAIERREHWLGKEAAKLRRAREAALERNAPWDDFQATLPALSSLAGAISQLYMAVKRDELAKVYIGPTPVQVLLRGELPLGAELEADERETDAKVLKRDVLEDSLLWRFLDVCQPTMSFAEYERLLDLDPQEHGLDEIVDYLVDWRKARIVDVVTLTGTYLIAASLDPKRLAMKTASFRDAFPSLPSLPRLLSHLSPNEPYSNLVPKGQDSVYLDALIWLLRNEVVVRQQTYVRVQAPATLKRSAGAQRDRTMRHSGVSFASSAEADGAIQLGTSFGAPSVRSLGASSRKSGSSLVGLGRPASTSSRGEIERPAVQGIGSRLRAPPLPHDSPIAISQYGATMIPSRITPHQHGGAPSVSATGSNATTGGSGLAPMSLVFDSGSAEESASKPSVIVEPCQPTLLESKWIGEMCRDKDPGLVADFERLVGLLNGRHCVDELRYRTQLSQKQLQDVFNAFEEYLIFFHRA
ncbi:Nitrogen permease regulator 3 [Rhodotorula sphaerocarpa]